MKKQKVLASILAASLLASTSMIAMAEECDHVLGDKEYFDYIPCYGGWKAVDTNYPYDYYYTCTECWLVIDEDGNSLEIDYFDAEGKHTPDFENEYPADYIPCGGGMKEVHYNCLVCGQYTDADGNDVEWEMADPDVLHTPDLEEIIFEADYRTCSGGYKEDRYFCVNCMELVNRDGVVAERYDGDGKHNPYKLVVYPPNWTACGGGYQEEYYECANEGCGEYVNYKGKELEYIDPEEDAVHDLEHIPGIPATCEDDGTKEYWKCKVCEEMYLDAEGEDWFFFEEDLVIEATGHSLEKVGKVEPTYEADGCKEHWKCETCGNLYGDEDGTIVVTDETSLVIPKLEKEPDGSEDDLEKDPEDPGKDPEDSGETPEDDKKDDASEKEDGSDVPKTGDNSQIGLLGGMMAVSAIAIGYSVKRRRIV